MGRLFLARDIEMARTALGEMGLLVDASKTLF